VSTDSARRTELLETAAQLFASSGLRVSLKEIGDACGILPGSLYHHFDSKEAMIVELVRRFRKDLDWVASQALHAPPPDTANIEERIVELGRSIAACGVRHRAALLLTQYDPPAVLGDELARQARQIRTAVEGAMLQLIEEGRAAGVIRPSVDLPLLSDRLCRSMFHVGVEVSHMTPGPERAPELRLGILLHGVARRSPSNGELDGSAATSAVQDVVKGWSNGPEESDGRVVHLREVARKEFGRRGYEATTMRDIATAAQLSTGSVYRSFSSKDELLRSVMRSYSAKVRAVWDAALASASPPVEKLDALMLANIHVVDHFSDELKIQLAWLRQSPPSTPDLGPSFNWHLRQLKGLLAEGARSREIHIEGPTADLRARSLQEATTCPPSVVSAGTGAAHRLARETVLRGAIAASQSPSG
jgi:AcrR family transcriptional regulator